MTLRTPPNQDIVVIGASGDLASSRLLPALYQLSVENLLPAEGLIIGSALNDWTDAQFREHVLRSLSFFSHQLLNEEAWEKFAVRLRYVGPTGNPYQNIKPLLTHPQRLVYFSVPPSVAKTALALLTEANWGEGTSLVMEKPFGQDLASAKELNQALLSVVSEHQIYRIDHYLAKETVQNLLVLRFANPLFERIWNRDNIHRIEITVAETGGVGKRGPMYEETGAIRDIVQNHLFQLLALISMEPPMAFTAASISLEKMKALSAVRIIEPFDVVLGQYTPGLVREEEVVGYRDEPGVSPTSLVETYVALKVQINSWRWAGTSFYLRTGKRLARKETRIVIVLRDAPINYFEQSSGKWLTSQKIVIRIQPNEGISMGLMLKRPGPEVRPQPVNMDFAYDSSFKTAEPEVYERLIHDALLSDHTLFISEAEAERGWELLEKVLQSPPEINFYSAGSVGPAAAEKLVAPRFWHSLEDDK